MLPAAGRNYSTCIWQSFIAARAVAWLSGVTQAQQDESTVIGTSGSFALRMKALLMTQMPVHRPTSWISVSPSTVAANVEGWGTGVKRIIDMCHEMNIREPEFLEIGDLLRVNLYRATYKAEARTVEECRENAEKVPCKCPVSAEKVYNAIIDNPRSSNKDLCTITSCKCQKLNY